MDRWRSPGSMVFIPWWGCEVVSPNASVTVVTGHYQGFFKKKNRIKDSILGGQPNKEFDTSKVHASNLQRIQRIFHLRLASWRGNAPIRYRWKFDAKYPPIKCPKAFLGNKKIPNKKYWFGVFQLLIFLMTGVDMKSCVWFVAVMDQNILANFLRSIQKGFLQKFRNVGVMHQIIYIYIYI